MQDNVMRDTKRPRLAQSHALSQSSDISKLYGVTFRLTATVDRFLIFRSDRRGAMAKIIFRDGLIDVLEVKPALRGHDLGGLLVSCVLMSIPPPITLEAEEVESKYGKLVKFYEQLGFQIKPNAKIQYLHHEEQVYRKVPMEYLGGPEDESEPPTIESFVPVHWEENKSPSKDKRSDSKWLLIADNAGVHFRSTRRNAVSFDENGEYLEAEAPHVFQLIVDNDGLLFRSATFGSYLSLNKQCFTLQESPVHWKTCENFGLCCVPDKKTLYDEQYEVVQTIAYSVSQRDLYSRFTRRKSLHEVLGLAQHLPGFPLKPSTKTMSLQERCFGTAEALRNAGHPDWVQLLGLLYHLGATVPVPTEELQWQYSVKAHMLSDNISTWTGPIYMYHMVRHNQIDIPEDGIQVLRLVSLSDNSNIQDRNEDDIHEFVAECDQVFWDTELPKQGDCEWLWNSHYARIATKYSADGVLGW